MISGVPSDDKSRQQVRVGREQGGAPRQMKQDLIETFVLYRRLSWLEVIRGITLAGPQGGRESVVLEEFANDSGEMVMLSNIQRVSVPATFSFGEFYDQVAKFGNGVRIAGFVPATDKEVESFNEVLQQCHLSLSDDRSIDLFPVRILGFEGEPIRAWLLTTVGPQKVAVGEDGLPASFGPAKPEMAYKRYWWILPAVAMPDTAPYFKGHTFEDEEPS